MISGEHIKSSRQASRLYDNCGLDIHGIPLAIQCKNVKANLNYTDILNYMEDQLGKYFPKNALEHKFIRLIRHQRRRGKKISRNEDLIIMSVEDFFRILEYTDLQKLWED